MSLVAARCAYTILLVLLLSRLKVAQPFITPSFSRPVSHTAALNLKIGVCPIKSVFTKTKLLQSCNILYAKKKSTPDDDDNDDDNDNFDFEGFGLDEEIVAEKARNDGKNMDDEEDVDDVGEWEPTEEELKASELEEYEDIDIDGLDTEAAKEEENRITDDDEILRRAKAAARDEDDDEDEDECDDRRRRDDDDDEDVDYEWDDDDDEEEEEEMKVDEDDGDLIMEENDGQNDNDGDDWEEVEYEVEVDDPSDSEVIIDSYVNHRKQRIFKWVERLAKETREPPKLDDQIDNPQYQRTKEIVEQDRERRAIPRDEGDLLEALDKLTPEQQKEFWEKEAEADELYKNFNTYDEKELKNFGFEEDLRLDEEYYQKYNNFTKSFLEGEHLTPFLKLAHSVHLDDLSNQTKEEFSLVWNATLPYNATEDNSDDAEFIPEDEDEGEEDDATGYDYNVTRWLLYDQQFNVSNLMLAAFKHNRDAPILFPHWQPQLEYFERYQHVRDMNYHFTWEDVENADLSELQRYYKGIGYDEIPNELPGGGHIVIDEMDEDEIRMAAFQRWMTEAYNPAWDEKDFGFETVGPEDNVFSEKFIMPKHPDLPVHEDAAEEIDEWVRDMGDDPETREYRDMVAYNFKGEVIDDEEFKRDFRGHVVIACSGLDSDLEIAEKLTARMKEAHGKQVFVETRLFAHAREEDCVFEIWIESYDVKLLHSKRRATFHADTWKGRRECDDEQIEYLVDRVGFYISDLKRYSYYRDFTPYDGV